MRSRYEGRGRLKEGPDGRFASIHIGEDDGVTDEGLNPVRR